VPFPTLARMSGVYTYTYSSPSRLTPGQGLVLSTSAQPGRPPGPAFFRGFAARPGVVAAGLLAVAEVARARYFQPADVAVRDPVITSDGAMLRLESFSDCCGVHARLDLLPAGLDGALGGRGTTNVDVGEPLRRALARTDDAGLLHLAVGDDLTVTTGDGAVIERTVPLPRRWVRGFAEVQVLSAALEPRFALDGAAAVAFLNGLGGAGRATGAGWVVPSGRGARTTSRAVPGAVCLPGPARLGALRPLLRYARALRAYGPPVRAGAPPAVSAWELQLPDARLVLTLSPEVRRGFSGEGALLHGLAASGPSPSASDVPPDADRVLAGLRSLEEAGGGSAVAVDAIAQVAGLPAERVRAALTSLGASGRVGFDVTTAGYFVRELPYRPRAVERDNPRLAAARTLVDAGAVGRPDPGGDAVEVVRDGRRHRVRREGGRWSCTCPWYAANGRERGPCAHVLAAQLAGVLPDDGSVR